MLVMDRLFANKRSTSFKISQFVAVSIAIITLSTTMNSSAFNIHQTSSYQLDCVFLECERNTFDKLTTHLTNSNGTTEECSGCRHCTSAGYSVCMRLRESALRARRAPDETIGDCGCAHTIPQACDSKPIRQKPRNDSTKLFNVCYHSALQLPPKPQAENRRLSVLLIVEPFWLQPYWRSELTLSNFTIRYKFPIRLAENCDGEVIKKESDNHFDLMCSANLTIGMSADTINSEKDADESALDDDNSTELDNLDETIAENDDDDYYEDDGFSEVQFDRAVFAGAKFVKFWYTVDVQRPRQLNNARRNMNDAAIIDVESSISSEILEFDLETDKYGFGDAEGLDDEREMDKADDSGDEFDLDDEAIDREAAADQELLTEKSAAEIAREIDFFADDSVDSPMNDNEDGDADESGEDEDEEQSHEISESTPTEVVSDGQLISDTMKVSDEDDASFSDVSESVDQDSNETTHENAIESNTAEEENQKNGHIPASADDVDNNDNDEGVRTIAENEKTNTANATLRHNKSGADMEGDGDKEAEGSLKEIEEVELAELTADDEVSQQPNELSQEEESEQHPSEVHQEEEVKTDSRELNLSQDEDQSSNELAASISDSVNYLQQDTSTDVNRELITATFDMDRYSDDSLESHRVSSAFSSTFSPSPITGEAYESVEREDEAYDEGEREEFGDLTANLQEEITSTGKSFITGEESVPSSTLNQPNRINGKNDSNLVNIQNA
ncbi:unnamed protein product [Anisakis simplex]|uniref:Kazal-like domain-containing protein n=1 Tax=Anisakis simplex TaxID=6269 RepID=A0A0M3JS65_ANISI|nr:unnamed protein product [Anisakis simplex]